MHSPAPFHPTEQSRSSFRDARNPLGGRAFATSILVAGAALTLSASQSACAADLPIKMVGKAAATTIYDWTGFYVGGHVAYGRGDFGTGTNPLPAQSVFFPYSATGLIGGFQAGYNVELPSHVVFGGEADIAFISPLDRAKLEPARFHTTFEFFSTVRGRIGYAFGPVLPYLTGGIAVAQTQVNTYDGAENILSKASTTHLGWTLGTGVEIAVGGPWTAKFEYTYIELGKKTFGLEALQTDLLVNPTVHSVKIGLNYRLWDTPPSMESLTVRPLTFPESNDWNVHGQTTFIQQAYPRIRSPYEGANSLPGGGEGRETLTVDAFLGWRLWDGAELYFNPEVAQGFGLNGTLGLAGFSNGEAQKGGAEFPKFRPQRYFLRQTFGFGGGEEDVVDGPNQLAGKRDVDRITVTIGRFAVSDFFDGNSYAKDPRADFMNWSLWSSVAYDFPADLPGFTRGAVIELNRKDWALRAGVFQPPTAPNSDLLSSNGVGGAVEFEGRYAIAAQPGKLRFGVFETYGNAANYRDALTLAAVDPLVDINTVTNDIRKNNRKYGVYFNAEQQITTDLGVFARASWNNGQNEALSFTDVDRCLSAGVSIKGNSWGRPNDTIGFGGAINGLSSAHRDFLAVGGIGLLIGDGTLNYAPETIFEFYYAYSVNKWATLTLDYQQVFNPAYNADRGPVSLFSARAHAEF